MWRLVFERKPCFSARVLTPPLCSSTVVVSLVLLDFGRPALGLDVGVSETDDMESSSNSGRDPLPMVDWRSRNESPKKEGIISLGPMGRG
eukprot:5814620-Prymnesium_polylepis.1